MALQKIVNLLESAESHNISSPWGFIARTLNKSQSSTWKWYMLLLLPILTFPICIVYHFFAVRRMLAEGGRITHPHWAAVSAPSPLAELQEDPPPPPAPLLLCPLLTAATSTIRAAALHPQVADLSNNSAESKGECSPGAVLPHECMKTGAGGARAGVRGLRPSYVSDPAQHRRER